MRHAQLATALLAAALARSSEAQTTTRYLHDGAGRLIAVIAPTNDAAVYGYDAAGNPTGTRKLAAGSVALLAFFPHEGAPGDRVTLVGLGFGDMASTQVTFNGATATIASATPNEIVVTVPASATGGPITITTAQAKLSSSDAFAVDQIQLSPRTANLLPGQTLQFTASVSSLFGDQTVQWTVNGIPGGDPTVGVVSDTGVYHAPGLSFDSTGLAAFGGASFAGAATRKAVAPAAAQPVSFTVSVSSSVMPSLHAEAQVNVLADFIDEISPGVTVRYAAATTPTHAARFAQLALARSTGASLRSPVVYTVTPRRLVTGKTTTVRVTGLRLTAGSAPRFVLASGAPDPAVSVSTVQVARDGRSLTCKVAVAKQAMARRAPLVVTTRSGSSPINARASAVELVRP